MAALVAGCFACAAQDNSTIVLSNGAQIEAAASFGHPTGEQTLNVEMARSSGNSFYRIFWDQNHLAVFAYEIAVDLTAGGDRLLATAKPVEDEFAHLYPDADAGKPVPTLSSDHDLGPLATGESATIPLFNIPGMGLDVSDAIRVKLNQSGGGAGPLRFSGLQIATDREQISGTGRASVSGRYAMFYIPGRGAYIFSAQPVAGRGFIDAGIITGTRMDFSIDNESFHVTAGEPILTRPESGDVWVYHDAGYRPSGNWTLQLSGANTAQSAADTFFTAASDSLGWWLR